jgi:hypothetical protein
MLRIPAKTLRCEGVAVKINVNIECTPEEARRFMGLPDLTPVHDAYLAQMLDAVNNGVSPDMMTAMVKSWAPMSDAGMKLWQGVIDQATGSGTR